jgi:hypothetical protein
MRILTVVSLILAVGAIAIAIVALERKPTRSSQLVHQVADLRSRVESLSSDASTSERLASRFGKLLACLPELVGEINGLTPEVVSGSVYLSQHSQISSYCAPVLEASTGPR